MHLLLCNATKNLVKERRTLHTAKLIDDIKLFTSTSVSVYRLIGSCWSVNTNSVLLVIYNVVILYMVRLTILTAEDKRKIKQQLARDRLQSAGYTPPSGLTPAQQKAQRDYYNKLK